MHTQGSPPSPASWPSFINRRWFSSSGPSFIDLRPSALTPAPHAHLPPLLRSGSIPRAPGRCHHPSITSAPGTANPGAPAAPHPRLSRDPRAGSQASALGVRMEPALSSSGRQIRLARWPRRQDPLSQARFSCTHPISHGRVSLPPLTTGLVRKQMAQLVLTESSSVRRRRRLLLPAILRVSGGNAGSWQRLPPPPPRLHLSGPALPAVAPQAVETVEPPENYNPRGALRA